MTPEDAYKTKGQNPNTGIWVNEWHAYGSVFSPQPVKVKDDIIIGMRHISVMDFASGFHMDFEAIPEKTSSITTSQITPLFERVFKRFGKPTKGLVVSHSCWLSSRELAADQDTSEQGKFLEAAEVEFDSMPQATKDEIIAWGDANDLTILFDADEIPIKPISTPLDPTNLN